MVLARLVGDPGQNLVVLVDSLLWQKRLSSPFPRETSPPSARLPISACVQLDLGQRGHVRAAS
jgi:hypothetical protein